MKDKLYDPARHNEKSPAPGMAAVNTHMPEETPEEEVQQGDEGEREGETERERGREGAERQAPFGE